MSLRYATIVNEQADGTGEAGTGGQRAAFKKGESEIGISNPVRLLNLFPKSNADLVNYNPTDLFKDNIIDETNVGSPKDTDSGNPDFQEGVNLNYDGSPSFNLEERIETTDKPQHGVPNVRVEKDDLADPLSAREPSNSPRRLGGFGTEYQINDLEKGKIKRERIGKYFKTLTPVHAGGTSTRLGKSDPVGTPYIPLDRSED